MTLPRIRITDLGFGVGFLLGFLSLALISAGLQAVEWLLSRPWPQSAVEALTTPVLSVVDLVGVFVLLLVFGMLAVYPGVMPRP